MAYDERRAAVRNSADPKQVARADRQLKDRIDITRAAYRAVLETPAGRFVMWDLMMRAGVFRAVWTSSAEIHARAAKHDFGLEIMGELQQIDGELFLLMQREWYDRERKLLRSNETANAAAMGGATSDDSSNNSDREG